MLSLALGIRLVRSYDDIGIDFLYGICNIVHAYGFIINSFYIFQPQVFACFLRSYDLGLTSHLTSCHCCSVPVSHSKSWIEILLMKNRAASPIEIPKPLTFLPSLPWNETTGMQMLVCEINSAVFHHHDKAKNEE